MARLNQRCHFLPRSVPRLWIRSLCNRFAQIPLRWRTSRWLSYRNAQSSHLSSLIRRQKLRISQWRWENQRKPRIGQYCRIVDFTSQLVGQGHQVGFPTFGRWKIIPRSQKKKYRLLPTHRLRRVHAIRAGTRPGTLPRLQP